VKVAAPGKLLLSGAYAVLDGAPALVVAVDRRAIADGATRATNPTPEVLAALSADEAPQVDASALREGELKLGLGSSAAMLVASIGVKASRLGRDLRDASVRHALFADARRAHAQVQGGGSGVDVAASVYGGALAFSLEPGGAATVTPAPLPAGLVLDVFWCGAPAITSSMRARVDALRQRDGATYRARTQDIATASSSVLAAGATDDVAAFVRAAQHGGAALAALGHDADAPIFPPSTSALVPIAESEGAAFVPSGAGGGDVFVHIGARPSSARFRAAATAAGLRLVPMNLDLDGVRLS